MKTRTTVSQAFTLIELLIVVAIIGILAAIAVPNFLNARMRATVSRTQSDLRALSLAIESYQIDNNAFPPSPGDLTRNMVKLTTPISYIGSVDFTDIFKVEQQATGNDLTSYLFFSYKYNASTWMGRIQRPDLSTDGFCLSSWGPDRVQGSQIPKGNYVGSPVEWLYIHIQDGNPAQGYAGVYNPTNGLLSAGDIGRWGGNVPGVPQIAGG